MQFLEGGKYLGVVLDGNLHLYPSKKEPNASKNLSQNKNK
jgi:hypothetical protein